MRTQRETVNGYTFTSNDPTSVGDWQGHEVAACERFDAIIRRVAELLPENDGSSDADFYWTQVCHLAWDRYGSEDLPNMTAAEIEAAARVVSGIAPAEG